MMVETLDFKKGSQPRTAIIIPAFNEALTIADTIKEYRNAFPWASIVVVDNNSTDDTSAAAQPYLDSSCDHLLQERRKGKGFAVKKALSRVDTDIYVMTDADATYPATDAKRLYEIMLRERADMLVGDRISGGAYGLQNKRLGHSVGNRLLTLVISRLAGQKFSDVLSGLRVMSRPYVANLDVRSTGFQLETEMNLIAAHLRADVIEEPIDYRERTEGSVSKLSTMRDGVRILIFALGNWVAFLPMQLLWWVAIVCVLSSIGLSGRVLFQWYSSGFTQILAIPSAIAAAGFAVLGLQSFFAGLVLRILGRGARRNDIAKFVEARRCWNRRLDAAL